MRRLAVIGLGLAAICAMAPGMVGATDWEPSPAASAEHPPDRSPARPMRRVIDHRNYGDVTAQAMGDPSPERSALGARRLDEGVAP
jgi:hypothetical protein